jgi:hypothetical protein
VERVFRRAAELVLAGGSDAVWSSVDASNRSAGSESGTESIGVVRQRQAAQRRSGRRVGAVTRASAVMRLVIGLMVHERHRASPF